MINLLPVAERRANSVEQLNYYTLMGGIVVAIGAISLAALLLIFDQVYQLNLDQLKGEKAAAEAQAVQYLDVEKKADSLSKQLESLKKAQAQTTHWATLLTELQALTPPSVSVKNAKFTPPGTGTSSPGAAGGGGTRTDLTGTADSRRSLGQFQIALSQSKYFKNVEIQTSAQKDSALIDYKLTLEVSYERLNGPPREQ